MFNNKKQLLCSNNLSLEIKKNLTKSCIWCVALYRSETLTLWKNEERAVNAFETCSWRRMLKIKWTDRIMNDEVFQRAKEERLLLKILKNRRHPWIGHTIRHKNFAVNILEGAIFRKKAVGRPRLEYLKQVARNTEADSYTAMKRMARNNSRCKAANQSKDWRIRRRRFATMVTKGILSHHILFHYYIYVAYASKMIKTTFIIFSNRWKNFC